MSGMSGGSFTTVLSVMEKYGTSWLSGDPEEFFPGSKQPVKTKKQSTNSRTGHRLVPVLGHLTTSLVGISNESVVYRSAGLNPDIYGLDFEYREYLPVPNFFAAVTVHLLTKFAVLLLSIPLFRNFTRCFSFEPGSGPDIEASRKSDRVEFRAVGLEKGTEKILAKADFVYDGALPEISGILAAEAADVLLRWSKSDNERTVKGGLLTPSLLGMAFVERIRGAGVLLEVQAAD